jgi:uncharacterized protein (DUF1810 family)
MGSTHSHTDNFGLDRFVTAQRGSYDRALAELRSGKKRSHWIWYVFPQVAGLGSSSMANRYAIQSRREGAAYLAHPILGPRLIQCAEALLQLDGKTAEEVMGHPDDLKLRSSMTLFAALSAADSPFQKVLNQYFSGIGDVRTTEYLELHDGLEPQSLRPP